MSGIRTCQNLRAGIESWARSQFKIDSSCGCNSSDSRRQKKDLAVLEQGLQEKLKPYEAQFALLKEIPGVDWTLATGIIAELGVDMRVFGSVSQLASWARVCPGNNESAGKRKSSRIPNGNVYLKPALVEAPNSAAKAKGTYLRDKFHRLNARCGYQRATVAVAHKILAPVYHRFSHQDCYNELGDACFHKRNRHQLTRNLVHPLERLAYSVTLEQKTAKDKSIFMTVHYHPIGIGLAGMEPVSPRPRLVLRPTFIKHEADAVAALPVWLQFSRVAIAGKPVEDFQNVVPLEKVAMTKTVKVDTPEKTSTQAGGGPTHDEMPSENSAPAGSAIPPLKPLPAQALPEPTPIATGDTRG